MTSAIPSFDLCTTEDSSFMPVLICDDGTQIELPPHSAAELLLAAAEIDLTAYTGAVRHLRETHLPHGHDGLELNMKSAFQLCFGVLGYWPFETFY